MEEAMKPWRLLPKPNSVLAAILPDELMVEIFTLLPVKPLIRFKCVNKFFKTLISDPYFVQMHLNKSSRNSQLALLCYKDFLVSNSSLVTLSFLDDPYYQLKDRLPLEGRRVVASCDGLLLIGLLRSCRENWLYFWNPAMRTKSEKFTIFSDFSTRLQNFDKFSFGYDNSTRTYKVVGFYVNVKPGYDPKIMVKVFSLADNYSRDIQCFPALPLYWSQRGKNNGVHLNGTIYWLAFRDYINSSVTIDQCVNVILSLDLSTETYTQLLLPRGFDKLSQYEHPSIVVLMDCLCFCHDFEKNCFVIWQMKDFGVQDSWIQLFKISFENIVEPVHLLPLYLSKNGDTLILVNYQNNKAFSYNSRDNNRVESLGTNYNDYVMWTQAKDYVESLVSIH